MNFDQYVIRIVEQSDARAYFELIDSNRPRLEGFFAGTVSKTQTLAATQTFISDNIIRNGNKEYYPFVVIDQATGKIIGYIDVKNIDWRIPKAELGCFIDERYAGKGISQRALSMVINYLFTELKMLKLFLRTHEENGQARNLAEKCGFKVEGHIRKDYRNTQGEIIDLLYYGLVNEHAPL